MLFKPKCTMGRFERTCNEIAMYICNVNTEYILHIKRKRS